MLSQAPTEQVTITAQDGTSLVGHWYPCDGAKRVIIAMHGWRSSWCSDFGLTAEFLHANHCSVLFAEQRGQNSSGGDYMGFGVTEQFDCLDWVHWGRSKQIRRAADLSVRRIHGRYNRVNGCGS